jgi:hypothetical protein
LRPKPTGETVSQIVDRFGERAGGAMGPDGSSVHVEHRFSMGGSRRGRILDMAKFDPGEQHWRADRRGDVFDLVDRILLHRARDGPRRAELDGDRLGRCHRHTGVPVDGEVDDLAVFDSHDDGAVGAPAGPSQTSRTPVLLAPHLTGSIPLPV